MDITFERPRNRAILPVLIGGIILVWFAIRPSPPSTSVDVSRALSGSYFRPPDGGPQKKWRLKRFKSIEKWTAQFKERGYSTDRIQRILETCKPKPYTHPSKPSVNMKIIEDRSGWIIFEETEIVEVWQVAPKWFIK